jgi:hypothetical protein
MTLDLSVIQFALEAFVFLAVLSATALFLWPEPAVEPEPDHFDDFDTEPQCEEFYAAD